MVTTAYEFEPTVLCEILHDLPRHFRATRDFEPALKSYKTGIATLAFLYSSCLLVIYMIVLIVNVLLKAYKTRKPTTYEVPFILKICVCLWCGPVLLGLISECFLHQAINNSFHVEEDPSLADIRNNIQEAKAHLDKATMLLRDFYMVARDYRKSFSDNYYFGYIDVVRGRIQSYEKLFPLYVLNTTLFEDVEDNETLRFYFIICAWIFLLIAGVLAATTMMFGSAAAGEFVVGVGALWSLIGCVFGAGIVLCIAITTADACINPSEGFLRAVDQTVVNGIYFQQYACRVRSAGDAKNTDYVQQLRNDIKEVYKLLIKFNYGLSLAYEANFKLFYMMENALYEIKQAEINIEYFRGGPFKPCKNDSYVMEQISRPVCVQGLNSIAIQFSMLNLSAAISFFILFKYSGLRRVRLGDKNLRELLLSLCLVPPNSSECMSSVCRESNMRSIFALKRKYQKPVCKKKMEAERKASNQVLKKVWPLRKTKHAERFVIKKIWFLRKYKLKSNEEIKTIEQKKQDAEQFKMKKLWLLRKCKPQGEKKKSNRNETKKAVEKMWFLRRCDRSPKEEKNKEKKVVPGITNPDAEETLLLSDMPPKVGSIVNSKHGFQKAVLTSRWPQGLQLNQPQPSFYSRAQPPQFLGHAKNSQSQIQQQRSELVQQQKYFGKQRPETIKLDSGNLKKTPDFKEVHSRYRFLPRPNESNILETVPHSLQNLGDRLQTAGGYRLVRPGKTNLQTGENSFYKQRGDEINEKVGFYEYSSGTGFQKNKIVQDFKQSKTVTGMQLPRGFQIPGIGFQPVQSRLRQQESALRQKVSGMQDSGVNLTKPSLEHDSGGTQQLTFNLKQERGGLQQKRIIQQSEVLQHPGVLQQTKVFQQPGIFTQSRIGTHQSRNGLFQPEVEQQLGKIQQQGFELEQQEGGLQKTRVVRQPQQGLLQQEKSVQNKNELEQQGINFQESVSGTEQKKSDLQSTKSYNTSISVQKTKDNILQEYVSRKKGIGIGIETRFKRPKIFSPELEKRIQTKKNGVQQTVIDENGSGQPRYSFERSKQQLQQIKTDVMIENTVVRSKREEYFSQIPKDIAQETKIFVTDSVQNQTSKQITDTDLRESGDLLIPELDTTTTRKNKTADFIQQIENKTEKYMKKIESDVFQRSDNKEFYSDKEKSDNTKKQANVDTSKAEPEKIGAVSQKSEKPDSVIAINNLQWSCGVCCPDGETSVIEKKQVNIDICNSETKNIGADSKISEQQQNVDTSKPESKNSGAVSQIANKPKKNKISISEPKIIGADSEIAEKQENSNSVQRSDTVYPPDKKTSNDTKEQENIDTNKPEPENSGAVPKIAKTQKKISISKSEPKIIDADSEIADKQENRITSNSVQRSDKVHSSDKEISNPTKDQENIDANKYETENIGDDSQIAKKQENVDISKSEPQNIGTDSQIAKKQKKLFYSKSKAKKITSDTQIEKKQENVDASISESENSGDDSQIAKNQENVENNKPENIGANSQIAKKIENVDISKAEPQNIGTDSQIAKKQKKLFNSKSKAKKISSDTQIEKKQENVDVSISESENSGDDSQIAKNQENVENNKPENIGANSQIAKKIENVDISKSEPQNIGTDSHIAKKQKKLYNNKSKTKKIRSDTQIEKKQENVHASISETEDMGSDSQIEKHHINLDKSKSKAKKINADSQIEIKQENVDESKPEPQKAKKQEIEPLSCIASLPIKDSKCICMSPKALKQTHGYGQHKGGSKKTLGGLLAKFTCKSSSKPRTCCVSGSHICEKPISKATSKPAPCTGTCCSRSLKYGVCEKPSSKAKSKPEPHTCCARGSDMYGICEHPSSKSNKCCNPGASSNMYGTCKQPSWTRILKCIKTDKGAESEIDKMQRDIQNMEMDMQRMGMQNMYTQGMGRRITGTQQIGMPNIRMQGTGMPSMGLQAMGTQQRRLQDRGMQQISMQDLGTQQMDMQDMAMQRMSMQDMRMHQMGMQDEGMQRMSMQDMGMQQMGLQDMGIQQMGMQDMGMQQMGMQDMGMQQMDMQESGLQQMELQGMGMQPINMQDFGIENMNLQDYSMGTNENMQFYDTQYDASAFSTQEDYGEMSDYLNENILLNEPTCEYGRLNPGLCLPEECVPGSGLPGSCPPGTCLPEAEQNTLYNIEQDSYYPQTEMTDMRVEDAYSSEIPMTEYAPNMMMPERRLSNMEEIGRQMELSGAEEWGEMENAETGMQGGGMEGIGVERMGIRDMEMGRMETRGEFGMSQTGISEMAMGQEAMTKKGTFSEMTGRRGTMEMQQFNDAELQRQRMSQIDLAKKRYFLELTKHNKMCEAGRLNPGTCYPGFCVPGSGQPGSCVPKPDMKKIKMCKGGLANPGSCYPGFCVPGSGKPGSCMPTTNQKRALGNRMPNNINVSQIRLSQTIPMDNASYNTGMPNMNMPNMNMQNLDMANTNIPNMNMINAEMENMAYMNTPLNITNTDMTGMPNIDPNMPYMNMLNINMANMDMGNMNMSYMNIPNTNMDNRDTGNMNMAYMNIPNTNMANVDLGNMNMPNTNMNMGYMNMPNNDVPYYSNMVDMPNTGYSYYQEPSLLPQMPSELPQMHSELPQMPQQLPQMPSELPGPSQVMYSELKDTDIVKAEPERSNRLPSLMKYSGAPRMFPQQDDSCCDTGPINTFCLEEEERLKFKNEKKACFDKEKGICHERKTRPCSEDEGRDDDEQEDIEEKLKRKSNSRSSSPKPCTTCKPRKKPPTRKYC